MKVLLTSSPTRIDRSALLTGAEKCVQLDVCGFQQLFQSKTKRFALDKTCKQQTWLLESLLFLLEAGFGKLASKVVLPFDFLQGGEDLLCFKV